MFDSIKTEPEQTVQRQFRKSWLIAGGILALSVLLFRAELNRLPKRIELGHRLVPLTFEPASLEQGSVGPFRVVGAWRLFADDPRFGGLSGLALDDGRFIAISDSGVVSRFARPGSVRNPAVALAEVPGGPGNAAFKYNRDSEALAADPGGRGWWVSFENRNALWLYDRSFRRVRAQVTIDRLRLGGNRGVEAMIAEDRSLLLFAENGDEAAVLGEAGGRRIKGLRGWIGDAVRLPDGRIIVANRRPAPFGFSNALVLLERDSGGYRAVRRWPLALHRLANVEGLAAEPLPSGGTRLWMVTDNNLQQRVPTLLIALEARPQP